MLIKFTIYNKKLTCFLLYHYFAIDKLLTLRKKAVKDAAANGGVSMNLNCFVSQYFNIAYFEIHVTFFSFKL